MNREPEVCGEVDEDPLGKRARSRVADLRQSLGGGDLDVGEVVVAGSHLGTELGVGPASLLDGRGRRRAAPGQLVVERREMFQRGVRESGSCAQMWEPERLIQRLCLRTLECDFQGGSVVGSLRSEQLGGLHAEGRCERIHERQAWLAFAVLDHGEIRRLPPDELGELGEREAAAVAGVAQAAAEHQRVEGGTIGHVNSIRYCHTAGDPGRLRL